MCVNRRVHLSLTASRGRFPIAILKAAAFTAMCANGKFVTGVCVVEPQSAKPQAARCGWKLARHTVRNEFFDATWTLHRRHPLVSRNAHPRLAFRPELVSTRQQNAGRDIANTNTAAQRFGDDHEHGDIVNEFDESGDVSSAFAPGSPAGAGNCGSTRRAASTDGYRAR